MPTRREHGRASARRRKAGRQPDVTREVPMYPGQHAESFPDKPAYIMADSGETVTYRQLDERSNRCAHLLRSLGLVPGDSIAIFMENHARFLEICWAAQRSGLYYTAISSRLTAAEVAYIVGDCGARPCSPRPPSSTSHARPHPPAPDCSPATSSIRNSSPTGRAASRPTKRLSGPSRRPRSPTRPRAPTCFTRRARPDSPRACG